MVGILIPSRDHLCLSETSAEVRGSRDLAPCRRGAFAHGRYLTSSGTPSKMGMRSERPRPEPTSRLD